MCLHISTNLFPFTHTYIHTLKRVLLPASVRKSGVTCLALSFSPAETACTLLVGMSDIVRFQVLNELSLFERMLVSMHERVNLVGSHSLLPPKFFLINQTTDP